MTLSQDDATGAVTGNYTITGIPGASSGTIIPNSPSDILSGPNLEEKLQDNNGTILFFSGGPVTSRPLAGLGLDRSYQGELSDGNSFDPLYTVNMTH
jgi:hypothetical protein